MDKRYTGSGTEFAPSELQDASGGKVSLFSAATSTEKTFKAPVKAADKDIRVQYSAKASDTWVRVKLDASDVENDSLQISFHYNQRTGSRARRDQINDLESRGNLKDGFEILIPK